MSSSQPLWPRVTRKLKRVIYYPLDTYDLATGNRPPEEMMFVGDGSWRAVGSEFLRHFKTLGHLKPDHHVLDVGSGIGRMAAPLTRYLTMQGSYTGFDIVKNGVGWCQENITRRHPNFTFMHSDVVNKHYNPFGSMKASEYDFPFGNARFDFVFLTSVFTHMFPSDLENYLGEIARVLKPGGRCLITFFLITAEAQAGIQAGTSALHFTQPSPGYYTANPFDPEVAMGFDEPYIRNLFTARSLTINEPISFGSWCGRKRYVSFQDIVVATKL
jgi:SAM-dependent methyltransferase